MSERDDALRQDLGWTGPRETDYEPDSAEPPLAPATPPLASRPPVESSGPEAPAEPPAPAPPPVAREPVRSEPPRQPPQRYGRPPIPTADPPAAPTQPENPPWSRPPSWPAPPPVRPSRPSTPTTPQAAPNAGQPPQGQPQRFTAGQTDHLGWNAVADPRNGPTGSYADRIKADELVPVRRVPPSTGWRHALFRASFGLINVGQSPEEIQQAEREVRIRSVLRGHYKVGVMGKGGVGKTTVSATIGSIFAELRQEDRVVAIDADTSFGKLGSRVDPKALGSYWDLASDQHLDTFADVRSRVGNNAAGLFVLAGEATPARRRVLDPAIYREAATRLDRYFTISIIDCSSTMDSPVTQEVLRDLDALIVVSSPWVDGAATAGQTMDWLATRGLDQLLRRTVVVLNDSDGHADKRTRGVLANQFAGQGQAVVEVPFDPHLRPGGVIAGTFELKLATRRKFVEIAAALAEHFPSNDARDRTRR